MKYKKKLALIICISLCAYAGYSIWHARAAQHVQQHPFATTTPTRETIRHDIHASGLIKIKDSMRIGSLVAGLVKEIFVEENDQVTKGQLLATIDNGKSDTAIRQTKGALLQAQAQYEYVRALYTREKELYENGVRSLQEIQSTTQQYESAKGALMVAQAHFDAAQLEYDNTHIKAPDDGIIIAVGVKKGMRITTDLDATALFEIAKDITQMEAELSLEESAAGHVKRGQKVIFTVDNHPHKKFKTTIRSVSYAPYKTASGLVYRASVDIDNTAELLRPGMTLHATIKVAKKKNILAIQHVAFYLDQPVIAAVAQKMGYTLRPIAPAIKKEFESQHRTIKYIWVHTDNEFIEKAIETGIYNDLYIEAADSLAEDEKYLCDVFQPNVMDSHYKKLFRGAF